VTIYVALIRGINVGGRHTLPMKELRVVLERLGCRDVRTYIQSGNAVFGSGEEDGARLAGRIADEIGARRGFEPRVVALELAEFERALEQNPFPDAETDAKGLHVAFLASVPERPDLAALDGLRSESERFRLRGAVFYLHAPAGVGRSKLAASAEKLLGVPMTDRNWRTLCKLRELARELRP